MLSVKGCVKVEESLLSKYTKEKIEDACGYLNDKEMEIAQLYYGLNGSELKSKEEISKLFGIVNINRILYNIDKKLKAIIIDKKKYLYLERSKFIKELYDVYGKDSVEWAFSCLTKRDMEVAQLYYGLNGEEMKSRAQIKASLKIKLIDNRMSKINCEIKKWLVNEHLYNGEVEIVQIKENYVRQKMLSQVTLEELEFGMFYLTQKQNKMIRMFYGIGEEARSFKEIEKELNIFNARSKIDAISERIQKLVKDKEARLRVKRTLEIEKFLYEKFGKQTVLSVLSKLSSKEQYAILKINELNNNKIIDFREIAERLDLEEKELFLLFKSIVDNVNKEIDNLFNKMRLKY